MNIDLSKIVSGAGKTLKVATVGVLGVGVAGLAAYALYQVYDQLISKQPKNEIRRSIETPESKHFKKSAEELLQKRASTLTMENIEKGMEAYDNFPLPEYAEVPAHLVFQTNLFGAYPTPFYAMQKHPTTWPTLNGSKPFKFEYTECAQIHHGYGEETAALVTRAKKANNGKISLDDGRFYVLTVSAVYRLLKPMDFTLDQQVHKSSDFVKTIDRWTTKKSHSEIAAKQAEDELRNFVRPTMEYNLKYYHSEKASALIYVAENDGSIRCFREDGTIIAKATKPVAATNKPNKAPASAPSRR